MDTGLFLAILEEAGRYLSNVLCQCPSVEPLLNPGFSARETLAPPRVEPTPGGLVRLLDR